MKHVVFYETAHDLDPDLVRETFPAHREHWASFRDAGTLVAIGPFADPREGAMSVFTTREAAEAFAVADPFVTSGIVARWRILEWNEALLDPT
jgi:uncharacterized protein YciI